MTTQQTLQTEEYKQTELGELPKDWRVVKFEDCLSDKRVKVSKLQQSQFKKIGKFPIVDQSQDLIAGYWDNNEDLFSSPLPIVIFGDHTRTFKFIDFPFVCGPDGTKILIPEISKVFPKFFYYYLRLLKIPSRGYNRHYSLLKDYLIPLPPLPEQQKIAYIISTIQNAQEKTDNFINSLKELKKTSMKHLFTYGAVSFEDIDKVELKETEIGMMPKNWEETNVKSYCSQILTGGTPKTEIKEYYEPQEIPWMKSGEIQGLRIKKIETFISKKGLDNSNARILPKNSVVIALAGRGKTRGTTSILEIECTCNQSVVCMVPNEKLSYEFLHYHLSNIYFYIRNLTGDKDRTGLNKEIVGKLPLNLPSFPEQQRIASILSAIDSKIEAEEGKKKAFGELFNSMLKDLMTAKIRVNDLEVGA